jgi:hypothetical protein
VAVAALPPQADSNMLAVTNNASNLNTFAFFISLSF